MDKLTVEQIQDNDSFSLVDLLGGVVIDIAVPIAIATCLLITFLSLRTASNLSGRNSLKYYAYAFGMYFLSLGFPLLMLALSFFLDSLLDDIGEDTFNILTTIPVVVGTVFLVLGTRELRKEVSGAR